MTVPIFRKGYDGADVAPPSALALRHALGGTGADTQSARRDHNHGGIYVPVSHTTDVDPHTGYVLESLLDAKGDLYAASAADTPGKLTVGANEAFLVADSAQTLGVRWDIDAWATYTPTLANITLGNGQRSGFYKKIGRVVHFYVQFVMGSTSAMGSNPTYSLPVNASSRYSSSSRDVLGHCAVLDAAVANYAGISFWGSASTGALQVLTAGGTYVGVASFTATVPISWGNGDAFFAWGTYEAAA